MRASTPRFTHLFRSRFTPRALPVVLVVACGASSVRADDLERVAPPPALLAETPVVEASPTQQACEDAASCEPGPLLAGLLRLEAALLIEDVQQRDIAVATAIHRLGALNDARAVPLLIRLSRSDSASIRLAALAALGVLSDDARAITRLRETLLGDAPQEDTAVALPALLAWAARNPGEQAVPCPEGGACVADDVLLQPLLAYTLSATSEQRAAQVTAAAALADPRVIPFLLRLSASSDDTIRSAVLTGLAGYAGDARVRARLLAALGSSAAQDRALAVPALATLREPAIDNAFLAQRRVETEDAVKTALEVELARRMPADLKNLLEDERLAALEAANAPGAFDVTMRALLTAAAGTSAAVGGAAASAAAADSIVGGGGACYGVWGACAGGVSAAAITWFGLGDRKLSGPDVGLAVSAGAWGAFAGVLVPPTIGDAATRDPRHMVYAASGGALVGLAGGTVAALLLHPKPEDVVEYDAGVLAANLLTAGALLSFGSGDDARPFWGSLIGATVLGSAGAGLGAAFLHIDAQGLGHAGMLGGVGLATGLFAGGARAAFSDGTTAAHVGGAGFLGAGLGTVAGLALGQLKLVPTPAGMLYETWATIDFAAAGAGTGLLVAALADGDPGAGFVGAAAGALLGAGSTALFPGGVEQDYGDLLLQPLVVGFALYHGGVLAAAGSEDGRMIGAAMLLSPALASAGLVYAAPYIAAGTGDVLMIASTMGFAAYLSAMGLLSVSARAPDAIPAWGYVLGTALAMDLGALGGVGLNLIDVDHVGWRTTYVASVAAGTTLVVSLPGALLASQEGSPVEVSDVLLASTVVGAVIGLATMPLIDFRVAPDLGLGKRPGDADPSASRLELVPTVVAFSPARDEEPPLGFGVVGRF